MRSRATLVNRNTTGQISVTRRDSPRLAGTYDTDRSASASEASAFLTSLTIEEWPWCKSEAPLLRRQWKLRLSGARFPSRLLVQRTALVGIALLPIALVACVPAEAVTYFVVAALLGVLTIDDARLMSGLSPTRIGWR